MNQTLEFYEKNATELSARFESAQLDSFHLAFSQFIAPGAKVLEIGCGSGRDAARVHAAGYDVQAIDGCEKLLEEAIRLHPELSGRLHCVCLPADLPYADGEFAGFFSVACLMHFSPKQVRTIFVQLHRVLSPKGRGLVSLPARRGDINADGIDEHGRVFNVLPIEEWLELFKECGFSGSPGQEEPDSHGREGISWVSFFLEKI